MGVPAVKIGSRQHKRECGPNVIHVPSEAKQIESAIFSQLGHGRYAHSPIFGAGNAGNKIADALSHLDLNIKKTLCY